MIDLGKLGVRCWRCIWRTKKKQGCIVYAASAVRFPCKNTQANMGRERIVTPFQQIYSTAFKQTGHHVTLRVLSSETSEWSYERTNGDDRQKMLMCKSLLKG